MSVEELYNLEQKGIQLPSNLETFIPGNFEEAQAALDAYVNATPEDKDEKTARFSQTIVEVISNPGNYLAATVSHRGLLASLIKRSFVEVELGEMNFKIGIVVEKSYPISRIAITVFHEDIAIACRDVEVFMDTSSSKGNRPLYAIFNNKALLFGLDMKGDNYLERMENFVGFNVPIRERALSNGFYVDEEYRGKGIGRYIFFLSLELARLLGSEEHMVEFDYSRSGHQESYYDQFLEKDFPDYASWYFPLTSKVSKTGQFWVKEG